MRKIRLLIEFDGTRYAGWQLQANGLSVQQVVEEALQQVSGQPVRLISSGRTDAGVHARGMVAHFTTASTLPLAAFREGVNRHLPSDVAVRQAAEAPDEFHARHSARGKWYRYTLCCSPVRLPLVAARSWQIRSPLDLAAMRQGAAAFVGRHDFGAFRAAGCDAKETVRQIFSVELVADGELLHIDVRGDGFLRTMVRVMAGTLVEIGLGKRPATDIERLLLQGRRTEAGLTAPPEGLCLMEVWYEGSER